jgi:tRNA (cmo5U34)-methyltransferase
MNEFDLKAREWDYNPVHWERSMAIAKSILETVPLKPSMKALEYGAGTGILSILLSDQLSEITLMDSSEEMVKVMQEKVTDSHIKNLKPLFFDLEKSNYLDCKFDFIFSQMVLHHVNDINQMLNKFYQILKPGGYLAIADLYKEDGSFHGEGFAGHNGFDPEETVNMLNKNMFNHINYKQCYVIKKTFESGKTKEYPVFLMIANRL